MQDAVKEFEQRAHWNRPVKHDPVQDMEVDWVRVDLKGLCHEEII